MSIPCWKLQCKIMLQELHYILIQILMSSKLLVKLCHYQSGNLNLNKHHKSPYQYSLWENPKLSTLIINILIKCHLPARKNPFPPHIQNPIHRTRNNHPHTGQYQSLPKYNLFSDNKLTHIHTSYFFINI